MIVSNPAANPGWVLKGPMPPSPTMWSRITVAQVVYIDRVIVACCPSLTLSPNILIAVKIFMYNSLLQALSFITRCHVISSDVMWCHVISSDVMWSQVMSCDVMWCHVMSCDLKDVMWCHVISSDVMWCQVITLSSWLGQATEWVCENMSYNNTELKHSMVVPSGKVI